MGCMHTGLVLIVVMTGEWSEDRSWLGSISVYVEEIPCRTKQSKRSGVLLGSAGQYVGVPAVKNQYFLSCKRVYNSLPLVVVMRDPHTVCLLL
jgi:hypothetical protein